MLYLHYILIDNIIIIISIRSIEHFFKFNLYVFNVDSYLL